MERMIPLTKTLNEICFSLCKAFKLVKVYEINEKNFWQTALSF